MAESFLIDICVLKHALRRVDRHDKPSVNSQYLLTMCFAICHEMVTDVDDDAVFKTILHQEAKNKDVYSQEMLLLFRMTSIKKGKYRCTKGSIEVQDPNQYPSEDLHLVRAAIAEGISIITNDRELHDSIDNSLECNEKKIKAYSDSEALDYILTRNSGS